MSEHRFWHTMTYGCDSGDPTHEVVFYLEEGCEGPRERTTTVRLPEDHPFKPGQEVKGPMTASGRIVVPVPFIAGQCPACRAMGGCGHAHGQFRPVVCGAAPDYRLCSLSHVRWNEDRTLDPPITDPPAGAGAFLYPTREERRRDGMEACGRPVYPLGVPT